MFLTCILKLVGLLYTLVWYQMLRYGSIFSATGATFHRYIAGGHPSYRYDRTLQIKAEPCFLTNMNNEVKLT